jgi:glycosyltransferase involved in cell wall biosynthesis
MRLYSRVDRLHAVSSAIARWIIEERPSAAAQTKVIPNPIDIRYFNAADGLPGCATGSPKTIIYTGRIHPEKGLDILLRSLPLVRSEVPDARLRLVGPTTTQSGGGGEAFVAHLRRLADGLPVQFDPPIYDRAALAMALRQADVYCYPSTAEKGEASPVAPLEAMGVGLVPVCSDLPQYRDYLTEGVNGLVFDHRGEDAPRRLADALIGLLRSPARLRQMGQAAAQTASAYSNKAIAERFIEDFASLARIPSGRQT